jgi:hypothetical protein
MAHGAEDPKAAVIFSESYFFGGLKYFAVFHFYDGEELPREGPFAELINVPAEFRWSGYLKYGTLLRVLGYGTWFPIRMAWRVSCLSLFFCCLLRSGFGIYSRSQTFTLPVIPNNSSALHEISSQWQSISTSYLNRVSHLGSLCGVEFQPLPSLIGAHSESRGGNAMGLKSSDPDRIVLALQCGWLRSRDDETVRQLLRDMTSWLDEQLPRWNREAGLEEGAYMPLFMNDAMSGQDVVGGYKERRLFETLQAEADPEEIWKRRVGGYKFGESPRNL